MLSFNRLFDGKLHLTQIDPGKKNSDKVLKAVGNSRTNGVIFAGSGLDVTPERETDVFTRAAKYMRDKPRIWRPCHPKQAPKYLVDELSGFFHYFSFERVPNAGNQKYRGGFYDEWARQWHEVGEVPPFNRGFPVDTFVLNLKFSAKLLVRPRRMRSEEVVRNSLNSMRAGRVVYFEYSGKYGGVDLVRAFDKERKAQRIDGTFMVGGGIDTKDKAFETLTSGADVIVVGNTLYRCQATRDYRPFYDTIEGAVRAASTQRGGPGSRSQRKRGNSSPAFPHLICDSLRESVRNSFTLGGLSGWHESGRRERGSA
jgi:heptaprenylglyceryl phosphate synthase